MRTKRLVLIATLLAMMLSLTVAPAHAEVRPVEVLTGVRLVNVEKVDLAANTYKLDFYLWFSWDPGRDHPEADTGLRVPQRLRRTKDVVYVTEAEGFVQYRVKGDFVKTFDFTRYPFETQDLRSRSSTRT